MSFSEWKETELGLIPYEWDIKKIDEISEVMSGGTPSTKKEEYYGGEIPWITPRDLSGYINKYIFSGERSITEDGLNNSSAKLIPMNSILFSSRAPIGYVAIAGTNLTTNQGFKNLICDPKKANYNFMYYKMKSLKESFEHVAGGSTFKEVSAKVVKNFKIVLPPLNEQKAIADILSSLDGKIELNNQMNETLEEMAQALFKRWFVDFEFPNEEGQPYKSSGGEMVESELGMIPKGWEVKQIDNLATITRGASPRPIQDYMSEEGIPWVKISDATNSGSKYLIETKEFIKEEGRRKSREVTQGTLILSNSATPGIPKIMLIDACVHDGWLIFRNYKDTTIEFMYYVLLHEQKRILALSNGSVFRNLKTDILKNYKIVVPDKRVLLKFTKIIEEINENIKIKVLENKSLMEIRDNLLPKLMSGEIRVNDLES